MPGISSPGEKSTVSGHRFGSPGFTVTAFVHIKSKESRSTWLPAYGCNFPKKTREEFGSWIFSLVWQSKKWENFSSYLCIFCYGGSYSHLVRPRLALMKHTWPFPKLPNGVGQPVNELRILPSELDFAATLSCSCFSSRKGSQTN